MQGQTSHQEPRRARNTPQPGARSPVAVMLFDNSTSKNAESGNFIGQHRSCKLGNELRRAFRGELRILPSVTRLNCDCNVRLIPPATYITQSDHNSVQTWDLLSKSDGNCDNYARSALNSDHAGLTPDVTEVSGVRIFDIGRLGLGLQDEMIGQYRKVIGPTPADSRKPTKLGRAR